MSKKWILWIGAFVFATSLQAQSTRTISGNAGWRMISIPITGATVSDISDDTAIQGITGGSNTGDAANIYYNPASDGTGTDGWTTPTNMSTAWGDGLGIIIYFFDNTTAGSSELPIDLDATGSEPSSNVAVSLSDTFTLIGNPFQSNIEIDDISGNGLGVGLLKGGLVSPVKVWDDANSTYQSFNFNQSLILSEWQAFFLERDETLGTVANTLTIPTSSKTASSADIEIFSKASTTSWREIDLKLFVQDKKDFENKLYFTTGSHEGRDSFDGSKLSSLNGSPTIAFVQDFGEGKVLLSQDARALDPETIQEYFMEINDAGVSGTYELSWPVKKQIPSDWKITLIDLETEAQVNMQVDTSYSFSVEAKQKRPAVSSLLPPAVKAKSSDNSDARFKIIVEPATAVSNEPADKPITFGLEQNYPNPFNPSTTIKYSVGEAGPVSITVYNVMGQKVAELLNTTRSAGEYQVTWNASNQASGIYYYRLTAPGQVITRQMTLIK